MASAPCVVEEILCHFPDLPRQPLTISVDPSRAVDVAVRAEAGGQRGRITVAEAAVLYAGWIAPDRVEQEWRRDHMVRGLC
jgi:hypothetical protein